MKDYLIKGMDKESKLRVFLLGQLRQLKKLGEFTIPRLQLRLLLEEF